MKKLLLIFLLLFFCPSSLLWATTAKGIIFEDLNKNGLYDKEEVGLADVAISNGSKVVKSNKQGRYSLALEDNQIIFITKPSGYALPVDKNNLPQFFYRHYPEGTAKKLALRYPGIEATGPLPAAINFPLYKKEEKDKFSVICLADPQPQNRKELQFFTEDIVSQLSPTKAVFGLTLGDIMYNDLALFPSYIELMGTIGIPWHNVAGNHEINFKATKPEQARQTFKRYFGPNYYSFNYAKTHFVVLDNIHYKNNKYRGLIGKKQLRWLKQDLATVPQGHLIILLMHIPLNSQLAKDHPKESYKASVADRKRLFKLLKGRQHLLALAGHLHLLEHSYFAREEGFYGEKPLHLHTLSTASGSWWSGPLDERGIPTSWQRDGSPRGFYLLNIENKQATVVFRAANQPADKQLRIILDSTFHGAKKNNLLYYKPGEIFRATIDQDQLYSTRVLVNFFEGGPNSKVKLIIDQKQKIIMKRQVQKDPFIMELFTRQQNSIKKGVKPLPSQHLWQASLPKSLSPGMHKLDVIAKDEYGLTHRGRKIIEIIKR